MSNQPENPPATPVLDRIREIRQQSQAVGKFLEWLENEGYTLAVPSNRNYDGRPYCLNPAIVNRKDLLYQFFEIDQEQENAELEAILEYFRSLQKQKDEQEKTR